MARPPSPPMSSPFSHHQRAQRLADELLFPTARSTDASERVPRSHLDQLAEAGLYGLLAPAERLAVIEALAGGCLTTTFVWIQHHSALAAVAASAVPGLDEWLEKLKRGKWRAGIAVAGIRPGTVPVRARAVDGGWRINGEVPWVTGWGLVDVIHTAALGPDGDIVWALVDAVDSPTLASRRLRLVAVDASVTVNVRFQDHFVPAERVTGIEPYDQWLARDRLGLRTNGSLALGVAGRCCRLLGPGPLDAALVACRAGLDRAATSDREALPAARAAASELAYRAAGALAVASGSRAVLRDHDAQRLVREALFLLVFASRPAVRKELEQRFAALG
jgi:alkylation response protein AidB-like acyl-CoA dehydrogenase